MAMIPSSSTNGNRLNSKLQDLIEIMEQLKSKANDIQSEVRNEELQARKKRKSEVALWIEQVISFEEEVQSIETEVAQAGFFGQRQLSVKLDGIMERGAQLLQQSEFPRGLLLDDVKPEGLELVTEKMEGSTPSRVQDEVWGCFEIGERRVGIFGIGGVGKTSLAMHINNKILKMLTHLFNCVYYVTVSRETSVLKLQSDIAKALGHLLEYEDEPKRAAELRMTLAKREKSLLILDDVWEDIAMEKVGVSMDGDGCKLLITTRKRDVCRKMNCFPIKMNPLLHEESWDLFKKQLGNFEEFSLEIEKTARLVAKECDGLPLGIVTMARSMRGETCAHVWRDALKRLQNPCGGQHDMKEKVFRILRFSYDQLHDDKHQKCFLYCALYPEDWRIDRNELIGEFIAAGLLDGANRQEKIDEGHTLLNVLENASLLECVTEWHRRLVKMHDLVRDMAIEIIGSTGMVKGGKGLKVVPGRQEWSNKDLQWVSLMHNLMDCIVGVIPDCPNISVLLLQKNPLKSVSDCFFVHMIGLKFLNLSRTRVEVLPDSVSNLCNLNTLLLCYCCYLHRLPSLSKLTRLTELNLNSCSEMRTLPEGMQELASLEHLNIQGTNIERMHKGLFSNLLNLKNFFGNSKIVVSAKELLNLRQLEKLIGVHLDGVSWFNQFVDFCCLDQMKPCSVTVRSILNDHNLLDGDINRRTVFDGCRLRIGAEMRLVPHNVVSVEFSECIFGVKSLLDAWPSLGDATELECCKLRNCEGIQYIIPDGWIKPLQGIRRIELKNVDEFCGLVGEELRVHTIDISFSSLRVLEIKDCPKLKKLWMLNLDLPNLKEIEIADCEKMEEIFATENGETVKLPRLCSLKLRSLPKLMSIWGNCDVFFPHLTSLVVSHFPTMKKIGMVSYNPLSLETIHIHGCKQLEEIFSSDKEEQVTLPKLGSLNVSGCDAVMNIGMVSYKLLSLETIHIKGCKQLVEIFALEKGETGKLPRLRSLDLQYLPKLRSIWGTYDVFLPDLVSLEVGNCPMLKNVDEFCGVVAEEVRVHMDISFSGLRVLEIKDCRKLKKLWMLNLDLPNLEEIEIADCGQMEEIFATEKGETIKLPRLCSLKMRSLPELRSIWGNCDVFFPHLSSLVVRYFPMMKRIGMVSYSLLSLETIHIQWCNQLEEIFSSDKEEQVKLPKLGSLNVSGCDAVKKIGMLSYNLLSLETIHIEQCKQLEEIFSSDKEEPVKLPKLRSLEVNWCDTVKKIGMVSSSLLFLETIHIERCKQLEQILSLEKGETVELPRLRSLDLYNMPELRSIWGNCDACLPDLVSLKVWKCPMLKRIGLVSCSLPSLEIFLIHNCNQMEEIFAVESEAGVDEIQLPKLNILDLSELPELRSIWGNCDAVLPDLVSLGVRDCTMLKRIGLISRSLPSLETISIQYCNQMEEIFVVEAEAEVGVDEIQLPKLKKLMLRKLPELRRVSRETIVCNSLQSVSIGGEGVSKLENCPLSVIYDNGPLPVLTAYDVPEGWWDALHWNDPATLSLFRQLGCFHYSSFNTGISFLKSFFSSSKFGVDDKQYELQN